MTFNRQMSMEKHGHAITQGHDSRTLRQSQERQEEVLAHMRAEHAKRGSKGVDFKEQFDIASKGEWCEAIKDIVAMANSGGGTILIGVRNDGSPSGFDVEPLVSLDPAKLTDKIAAYTGQQFCDFEIAQIMRDGYRVAAIRIDGVSVPIIFTQPGTYDTGAGKQKAAFGAGTVYFRHGAKSEPGNTNDLRQAME